MRTVSPGASPSHSLSFSIDIKEILSYISDDWSRVQDGIRDALSTDIGLMAVTNNGLLAHSGKQLRPLLAILVSRALSCGKRTDDDSVKVAVAAELIHNATLLHDDVADEADVRRSFPTLRSAMGPSVSVLVGDFWIVRAIKVLLSVGRNRERLIDIFGTTLCDLAEGEMLQLEKASKGDTTADDYKRIIFCKTASLFAASARAAAISVGASEEQERAAYDFGANLGYAFQIKDDIFDCMPQGELGKPVGVDVMEKKITLPLLGALNAADELRREDIRRKVAGITSETRDEIMDFIRNGGGIPYAQGFVDDYVSGALGSLECFPLSREREFLARLAEYIKNRGN